MLHQFLYLWDEILHFIPPSDQPDNVTIQDVVPYPLYPLVPRSPPAASRTTVLKQFRVRESLDSEKLIRAGKFGTRQYSKLAVVLQGSFWE